jgi:hypothetical protein
MPWKDKPFGWGKSQTGETLFPMAGDATAKVLDEVRSVIERGASIGQVVFKVDTIESPSVELAIQLMLDQSNSKLKFTRVADSIPSPDPRKSSASHPLWKFRFGKPHPTLASPSVDFGRMCAELAFQSRDCDDSWERARRRSKDFTVDQIPKLLALMVHPPAIEGEFDSSTWLRRVQLAAAQLATCVEMNQEVSVADSRVADIILGPLDWSIDSALVALAQRARQESELSGSVCGLAKALLARVPAKGTWTCRDVAVSVMSHLATGADEINGDATVPLSSNREPVPPA